MPELDEATCKDIVLKYTKTQPDRVIMYYEDEPDVIFFAEYNKGEQSHVSKIYSYWYQILCELYLNEISEDIEDGYTKSLEKFTKDEINLIKIECLDINARLKEYLVENILRILKGEVVDVVDGKAMFKRWDINNFVKFKYIPIEYITDKEENSLIDYLISMIDDFDDGEDNDAVDYVNVDIELHEQHEDLIKLIKILAEMKGEN